MRHSQVVNVPQSSEFLKMSFLGPHPVCCRCGAPLTQTDMDARKKFADDNKLNPQISWKLNMNLPPYYFTIFSENVGNTEFWDTGPSHLRKVPLQGPRICLPRAYPRTQCACLSTYQRVMRVLATYSFQNNCFRGHELKIWYPCQHWLIPTFLFSQAYWVIPASAVFFVHSVT